MKTVFLILIMLFSPFFLWHFEHDTIAFFVGFYVFFSLPSIVEVCLTAYKDHKWPVVVGGPSIYWPSKR